MLSEQCGDIFCAAYGVNSNAPDFAKWLVALLGREQLSDSLLDAYFAPQSVSVADDQGEDSYGFGPRQISLGFFMNDLPGIGRVYHHDGNNLGFSSLVLVHPNSGWGFVAFANGGRSTPLLLEIAMFLNQDLRP